jgi:hypothetical protein
MEKVFPWRDGFHIGTRFVYVGGCRLLDHDSSERGVSVPDGEPLSPVRPSPLLPYRQHIDRLPLSAQLLHQSEHRGILWRVI